MKWDSLLALCNAEVLQNWILFSSFFLFQLLFPTHWNRKDREKIPPPIQIPFTSMSVTPQKNISSSTTASSFTVKHPHGTSHGSASYCILHSSSTPLSSIHIFACSTSWSQVLICSSMPFTHLFLSLPLHLAPSIPASWIIRTYLPSSILITWYHSRKACYALSPNLIFTSVKCWILSYLILSYVAIPQIYFKHHIWTASTWLPSHASTTHVSLQCIKCLSIECSRNSVSNFQYNLWYLPNLGQTWGIIGNWNTSNLLNNLNLTNY